MRQAGLRAKQKRRYRPRTTNSRHAYKVAPNLLATAPAPQAPDQIWQSDISYIQTDEGWLYFAFRIDAFTRKIVAHHCCEDLGSELATTTLRRAVQRQRPLCALIHHSLPRSSRQHYVIQPSMTPIVTPNRARGERLVRRASAATDPSRRVADAQDSSRR